MTDIKKFYDMRGHSTKYPSQLLTERDLSYVMKYYTLGLVFFPLDNNRSPVMSFILENGREKQYFKRMDVPDPMYYDWFDKRITGVGMACGPEEGVVHPDKSGQSCQHPACGCGYMVIDCDRVKEGEEEKFADGWDGVKEQMRQSGSIKGPLTPDEFFRVYHGNPKLGIKPSYPFVHTLSRSGGHHLWFRYDHRLAGNGHVFKIKDPEGKEYKVELKGRHAQITLPLGPPVEGEANTPSGVFYPGCAPWDHISLEEPFPPSSDLEKTFPELYQAMRKTSEQTIQYNKPSMVRSKKSFPLKAAISLVQRLPQEVIDGDRAQWTKMGYALSHTYGEEGREPWAIICNRYSKENKEDGEKYWDEYISKKQAPSGEKKAVTMAFMCKLLQTTAPGEWMALCEEFGFYKVVNKDKQISKRPEYDGLEDTLFSSYETDQAEFLANFFEGEIYYSASYMSQCTTWAYWVEEKKLWIKTVDLNELIGHINMKIHWYLKDYISEAKGEDRVKRQDQVARVGKEAFVRPLVGKLRCLVTNAEALELFDNIPYLFPLKEGKVVDLRTGLVRERVKEDFFTSESQRSMGDPNSGSVKLYITDLAMGDPMAFSYLQWLCGLCLTREAVKLLWIIIGETDVGKSFFVKLLQKVIGSSDSTLGDKEVLMKSPPKQAGAASPELAKLDGKRLVVYNEVNRGNHFNLDMFKVLTGQDSIDYRQLFTGKYKQISEGFPGKSILHGNSTPTFDNFDPATVRRIVYIPFSQSFIESSYEDEAVKVEIRKARENAAALKLNLDDVQDDFFAWAVQGAILYYKLIEKGEYHPLPESWQQVKNELIKEVDTLHQFLEEGGVELNPNEKIKSSSLYFLYKEFCISRSYRALPDQSFTKALEGKGFTKKKFGVNFWLGICEAKEEGL